jgi:dienelactone hydrolase
MAFKKRFCVASGIWFLSTAAHALHKELVDRNTVCFGMHCCPGGYGMRGYRQDGDQLLCRELPEPDEDCFIDGPTRRREMHACPAGTYMKGIRADRNLLACCFSRRRGFSELNSESVDGGSVAAGMHACPAKSTQDAFMTGLHIGNNQLLCATAPASPSSIASPVDISLNPFAPKTFSSFFPSVSHATWQRAVRNWLSRAFNLPVDGSHLVAPRVSVIGSDVTDEGIRRRKISYPSRVDGVAIKAYLLFPPGYTSSGSFPAAIVTHGHSGGGKDETAIQWESPYHAHAKYLAQQGFIVLAPDTRSWNEYLIGGLDHNTYTQSLVNLSGHDGLIAQMLVLDLLTNVSVLVSTPGVDRKHVHSVGLSLGAWQAMYLSALDTRITGKVVAAGNFLGLRCLNEPQRVGHHRCQGIHNLSASLDHPGDSLLFDTGDLAALIAPRPLYAMWGDRDPIFPASLPGAPANCGTLGRMQGEDTYNRLGIPWHFQFRLIPGMEHKIDNTTALQFLTGTTPLDQRDYGSVCNGMHCCPSGKAMGGVHIERNDLICRDIVPSANEQCSTVNTVRHSMLACPAGTWARGYHKENKQLTCCRDKTTLGKAPPAETVDPVPGHSATTAQGMHACPPWSPLITGIHAENNQLLCAQR